MGKTESKTKEHHLEKSNYFNKNLDFCAPTTLIQIAEQKVGKHHEHTLIDNKQLH